MIVIESLNHISVTVSNLDASIKFYKELFDFDVIDQISGPGQAFLRMGDILIVIVEVEGYKSQQNNKNSVSFYIDEDDFDDAVDELNDSEIKIIHGPENIRKGQRVVFLDPDNNQIELSYPKLI